MKISKSFKIALNIILHSKIRSWLTIIGIVIGIAAVVSIVSIGQGAERAIQNNLNSLSADVITISPGFERAAGAGFIVRGAGGGGFGGGFGGGGGPGGRNSQAQPKNLTVTDVSLLRSISNINYIMGTISGRVDNVSYTSQTSSVSVEGVDPAVWKNIVSTDLASGRYLAQGDTNVVVVGGRIANSTFSGMQINRDISINGKMFRIVGILQQSGGSDDRVMFMPISTAVTVIDNKNTKNFDGITVKIKDISQTQNTVDEITSDLMQTHGILNANKQDFSVTSMISLQQRVTSTLDSTSVFLTGIAIISLIVGAIGIMNSMFTSVLEKTREIGILKAIGAKDRDILTIFLLNSGIIGLIGGIFGIIVGVFASGYIAELSGTSLGRFGSASAFISIQLIVGIFFLSIFIGLISGAIPAYRASRLEPVDALRYE